MQAARLLVMGGVAWAASAGAAAADELSALKAEIEALSARVAAMESSPAVPEGYRLLSIGEGALQETPGAPLTARERAAYGGRATIISVVPSADAPLAASISWSGYTRAGVVYNGVRGKTHDKAYVLENGAWVRDAAKDVKGSDDTNDYDVGLRGQLLVQAKTGTAAGEVGVEMKLRVDANGNGEADFYGKVVWGYWAMTPELTLGGGYNQSLGDIVYGYDGSCTCYFTDNADVDFDPGDTSQLRLSYVSGPVTFAVAVEDAALDDDTISKGLIGVAGEIAYAGDVFSGEIAGVFRGSDKEQTGASQIWQLGVGGSIKMGELGDFTFAAATGRGPYEVQSSGTIVNGLPYDNTWWGASTLASINLGETSHVELAAGYKHRDGNQTDYKGYDVTKLDYNTYALMGGLYYTPVSQLTLGLEGEWYTVSTTAEARKDDIRYAVDVDRDTLWVDAVAVWSF